MICLIKNFCDGRRWKITITNGCRIFLYVPMWKIVTIPFPPNKLFVVNMIGSAKRTLYWLFNLLKYISCIFFVFKILYFCRTLLELYIEYNSKVKSVESPVLIQKEIQVHPLMSSILRDLLISKMKHAAIKFFFARKIFSVGK